MYLIIAGVAILLFYLGYRFHRYLEDKYVYGIHNWRAFGIFIGMVITLAVVYFYYVGQVCDSETLENKIERFKREYQQKVDSYIDAEYEIYYHECYYTVDKPKYVKKNFLNIRVLNPLSREEFITKYANQILPAGMTLQAPQSEIDKIISHNKWYMENAKKSKRIYSIIIPILILIGLGWLVVYNFRIFGSVVLAIFVTLLQYIWFSILIVGMLLVLLIISSIFHDRERRRRYQRLL